jgi:hypothetical protein
LQGTEALSELAEVGSCGMLFSHGDKIDELPDVLAIANLQFSSKVEVQCCFLLLVPVSSYLLYACRVQRRCASWRVLALAACS